MEKIVFLILAGIMLISVIPFTAHADIPIVGDVSENGRIDAADYAMVKRAVLGTYLLSDEQVTTADVSGNGKVDASDYAMIKRHVLGTYSIGGQEPSVSSPEESEELSSPEENTNPDGGFVLIISNPDGAKILNTLAEYYFEGDDVTVELEAGPTHYCKIYVDGAQLKPKAYLANRHTYSFTMPAHDADIRIELIRVGG